MCAQTWLSDKMDTKTWRTVYILPVFDAGSRLKHFLFGSNIGSTAFSYFIKIYHWSSPNKLRYEKCLVTLRTSASNVCIGQINKIQNSKKCYNLGFSYREPVMKHVLAQIFCIIVMFGTKELGSCPPKYVEEVHDSNCNQHWVIKGKRSKVLLVMRSTTTPPQTSLLAKPVVFPYLLLEKFVLSQIKGNDFRTPIFFLGTPLPCWNY